MMQWQRKDFFSHLGEWENNKEYIFAFKKIYIQNLIFKLQIENNYILHV